MPVSQLAETEAGDGFAGWSLVSVMKMQWPVYHVMARRNHRRQKIIFLDDRDRFTI